VNTDREKSIALTVVLARMLFPRVTLSFQELSEILVAAGSLSVLGFTPGVVASNVANNIVKEAYRRVKDEDGEDEARRIAYTFRSITGDIRW
jgi:hypothetical protein